MRRIALATVGFSFLALSATTLFGQEPAAAAAPTFDRGDNAWMLTSAALVLFMTAPGLALFYGGLVRKKNVLGVMMQCLFLMGLMTVIWAIYGYSLAFGGGEKWIGTEEYLLMKNVQPELVDGVVTYPIESIPGVFSIPRLTHMLFQGMFFIITPALICGAFAERMKFSTLVVFMVLWGV
jgi:ammonium transporter, Amt family